MADLEGMTKAELEDLARERSVEGRSSMSKAELRAALQNAEGDAAGTDTPGFDPADESESGTAAGDAEGTGVDVEPERVELDAAAASEQGDGVDRSQTVAAADPDLEDEEGGAEAVDFGEDPHDSGQASGRAGNREHASKRLAREEQQPDLRPEGRGRYRRVFHLFGTEDGEALLERKANVVRTEAIQRGLRPVGDVTFDGREEGRHPGYFGYVYSVAVADHDDALSHG